MANFDINAFVIDEPTRAIFMNSDDTTAWYTNQVQDFSIKVDGEEQVKKDAHGNTIATLTKGKTCETSFNVPVYDLNIVAALNGSTKQIAGTTEYATIATPHFEEVEITNDNKTAIVLSHTPTKAASEVNYRISVSTLATDGSPKKIFKQGASTGSGTFTYTPETKTIAFAGSDLAVGDTVLIVYEYETTEAVRVVASGNDFPKAGKLYVEVRGFDICDQNTAIYAYYRFPTAKLKTSYQMDIQLDSTLPMAFGCSIDYCSKNKDFYSLVVPSGNAEA